MKTKFLRVFWGYYLPLFFWLSLIFYLSSFHDIRTGTSLVFWEIVIRKIAHAGEFLILAYLFFRLFKIYGNSSKKSFYLSILFIFIFGILDEFHQSFVAGREARFMDVFFDFLGGCLGLYLLNWRKRLFNRKFFGMGVALFIILVGYVAWNNVQIYGKYFDDKGVEEKTEKENSSLEYSSLYGSHSSGHYGDQGESENSPKEEVVIPDEFLIKSVPFTSQAPFGSWDETHEESCEEASIIIVEYFNQGKKLSSQIAEEEIQNLVKFQVKNYGDYKDTNVEETARLARDFYDLNLRVVYDFSIEDMKKELSQNKLIIVPAAGRELGNPFFTPPGPLYHNLVIIGYDKDNFITNDPGTRRGENYSYDQEVLFAAIHDFPGEKKDILKGRKAMLVLE